MTFWHFELGLSHEVPVGVGLVAAVLIPLLAEQVPLRTQLYTVYHLLYTVQQLPSIQTIDER